MQPGHGWGPLLCVQDLPCEESQCGVGARPPAGIHHIGSSLNVQCLVKAIIFAAGVLGQQQINRERDLSLRSLRGNIQVQIRVMYLTT